VKTYKVPEQWPGPNTKESIVSPEHWHVDGYVWEPKQPGQTTPSRVNVKTGEWENIGVLKAPKGPHHSGYDIPPEEQNNRYLPRIGGTRSARSDAKTTDAADLGPGPRPHARPAGGHFLS